MGLLSALFSSVSGINAEGTAISTVGDNIANTSTVGFKGSRAEFVDVLSNSLGAAAGAGGQVGAGARVAGVGQIFTQGSLQSTGVGTDLAVDGNGFFIVQDTTGVFYSRAGLFRLDSNKQLVNPAGQQVLGFGIAPNGQQNGAIAPIDIKSASSQPRATANIDVNVNLDPNSAVLPGAFDHTDPINTSNFQTGIRVFDSLGNARNILIYFKKTATNTWQWFAGVNRSDLDLSVNFSSAAPSAQPTQFFPLQSGTLSFTTSGALDLENNTQVNLDYDLDGDGALDGVSVATPSNWAFTAGAAPTQAIAFDFGKSITGEGGTGVDKSTQFGGQVISNSVRFMNQDGFAAGQLSNISIDEAGFVTGQFSNGVTQKLAQVALAQFPSV
ncbi:MAG: flagellar hook protein FlgE, partial [Myxococcota bacterium]